MDLRRTPADESSQKVSQSITSALVSAVLEWMLMFMIFVDASFSYLVTRFARYCQLQVPCLLCSRLDHVLGNEKDSSNLFCHKHKLRLSSLVLCQLHNNLVDVHGTCESCFFSFATINKSNAETYRLLVGKLGAEPHYGLAQGDSSSNAHDIARKCACCNEKWISRSCTPIMSLNKSMDSGGAEYESSIISNCNWDVRLEKMKKNDVDPLPHVEYTQVHVTSDTESESPFSHEGSVNGLIREMAIFGQDPASEKLIHQEASPIKISHSESEELTSSHHNVEYEVALGHGLEEIKWQQADKENDVNEPSDLISFTDTHTSATIDGKHYEESKETNATSNTVLDKEDYVECAESSNTESDSTGTAELWKKDHLGNGETSRVGINSTPPYEIDLKLNKTDNISSQIAESLDLGDASKVALGTRGRQLSGRLLEHQKSMTDSRKASEDLKLLLSQISAARGFELSLSNMSPRVSANSEDSKSSFDPSGVIGMQMIQRRLSLERNESNLSLDGSTISEIEGETVLERLKRQVEHDKKIMGTLYKELEEEKNASEIAVNQAMAMITRLQEEKAALHMETAQCLRMMEEQAEYDGEALQQANELLAEKEKQIQDLEFELETYRNRFGDISGFIKSAMPESDAGEIEAQKLEEGYGESNMTAFSNSDNEKHDIVSRSNGGSKMLDRDIHADA